MYNNKTYIYTDELAKLIEIYTIEVKDKKGNMLCISKMYSN